ncbi:MAG: hypothetical protein ACK5LK_08000, partial [Chthoniobacterales bacterium]
EEWRLEQLNIGHLDIQFVAKDEAANYSTHTSLPPSPQNFLEKLLPRRFSIGNLHIENANLKTKAGQLRSTVLEAKPDGRGWIINGQRGKLLLQDRPELQVKSYRARITRGTLYLTSSEFTLAEDGKITLSGEVETNPQKLDFRVNFEQVPSHTIFPERLKQYLTGKVRGEMNIKQRSDGSVSDNQLSGTFFLNDGTLSGLPVLNQLAAFTDTPQFKRMTIQEVSGNFEKNAQELRVRNFVLESKGLLRVEGNYSISDKEEILGDLNVGLTKQTLRWIPGSRERVFTEERDGYMWAPVRVSGNVNSPKEDLSSRLAAAAGSATIESGVKTLESAPEVIKSGVDTAIDIFRPLLNP